MNIDCSKLERMMFTDEKIFTKNGYFNPKKMMLSGPMIDLMPMNAVNFIQ